jgi:pseudaminic acid biosynthesis-associated methylase
VSSQLERWQGEFGRAYTDRNQVDWHTRVEGFRRLVPDDTRSVFEVGCNRGHNLESLKSLGLTVYGCEPTEYARSQAIAQGLYVCACGICDLSANHTEDFDLVLTSGVLIHVPAELLDEALTNIYAAAERHILAIEYYADEDTAVEYRGHMDMLWKRDYGFHYLRLFPSLTCVSMGDLTEADGFAGARYWLLAK